jgi:hypothetical protein
MPGMSLVEAPAPAEDVADGMAPWLMPGLEGSWEELQAADVRARAAAAPTAARARWRMVERVEANIG